MPIIKINQLAALTSGDISSDDIILIMDDPSGAASTRKVTVADLTTNLSNVTFVSPSALSASTGDWNPGTGDVIRASASVAGVNISGIVVGNEDIRVLVNIGSTNNLTLKHQATGASSGNRIITSTGGDHIVPPTGTVTVLYDSISSRWRVL